MSVRLPVGFFLQLHPKFLPVAERRPAGDWAASRRTPADELICVTSANHPAKFNCELKCLGRRQMNEGVLVRAGASRFLPDLMQKSPRSDPTINFSLLGWQLKLNILCSNTQPYVYCWQMRSPYNYYW